MKHWRFCGAEFEEADTADRFAIEFEPLPEEEVQKEKGAKCGVLGKLMIKSGLPLGPINQTIRIQTRVDVEKDITIHMPIRGNVMSDIMIASAPKFEPSRSLVNFGPLKRNESAKIALQVYVKGDYRHDTKFSVGEVDPPEYLKVDIGPPQELNNGKTIRHTGDDRDPRRFETHQPTGSGVCQTRTCRSGDNAPRDQAGADPCPLCSGLADCLLLKDRFQLLPAVHERQMRSFRVKF